MEKMTPIEALCEAVVLELIEIKTHLCNGRDFEGGVGLGGLINSMLFRKDQEEDKRNEEVQNEECCEKCEESSKEKTIENRINIIEEYKEQKRVDDRKIQELTALVKHLSGGR